MATTSRRLRSATVLGAVLVAQAFAPAPVVAQSFRPALLVAQSFRPAPLVARSFRAAPLVAQAFRPALFAQSPTFGVGHAPRADELKQIDIDVSVDGKGLPPGSGTAAKGKDVYTRRCETCHGPSGKEGPQDVLSGGKGSLATSRPQKTVGSYWPYATTLWDYINRAMPFDHPSTLTPDEVYSATAYVLFLNGIVGEQDMLNQSTLPKILMPNRHGFVADPRPDVPLRKR